MDSETTGPEAPHWSGSRRFAFRFAVIYFSLYSLAASSAPLNIFLELTHLHDLWTATLPTFGAWLGIDRPIPITPTGSGDRTVDYVRVIMMIALALIGSVTWTALDRTRPSYPRAAAWLTVWARYWLASAMVSYGLYKVFKLQFPFPDVVRLSEPYGESSPGGLVWTFMGYSTSYSAFTGGLEVLGGVLLLSRRTTTLGALICVGVMANVVALNFGYDIAVKLFSSHLLLVALVLAGIDARRLIGLFVLGHAVPAREVPPVLESHRKLRLGLKGSYITAMGLVLSLELWSAREFVGADMPPLYGLYDVSVDQCEGDLTDDRARWRQVAIGLYGLVAVYPLHGQRSVYSAQVDTDAHTLELTPRDGGEPTVLHYEEPEAGVLILEGTVDGIRHRATLHRVDENEFLLVNHGFHWINEEPLNR
jgi:uncharacterized membrane protein YphA (DoxX/SURF4 family)